MSPTRFEDRILELLVEEITTPTLPVAEAEAQGSPPGDGEDHWPADPASGIRAGRSHLVSRSWRMGIAAAVLLALALGGLVVAGRDSQTVLTDTPATSTPSTPVPYLTFGDPPGEVFRTDSVMRDDPLSRYVLRDPSDRDGRSSRDMMFVLLNNPDVTAHLGSSAGVIGGRPTFVSPEDLAYGGSVVYWFGEGDATWVVYGQDATVSGLHSGGTNLDAARLRNATVAFLSELRMVDDRPVAGPSYQEIPLWERAYPVWSINTSKPADRASQSDGSPEAQSMTLAAYRDTTTEIDDLPGTRATVRGHPAVVGYLGVVWRETPDSIVILTGMPPLEELVRIAQELVESDEGAYQRLPGIEADPEHTHGGPSIVVTKPSDAGDVLVRYVSSSMAPMESVGLFGSQGKVVIAELPFVGAVPRTIPPDEGEEMVLPETEEFSGVYLWAQRDDDEWDVVAEPPACATKVPFPAPGSPPTQVELDLDCMTD